MDIDTLIFAAQYAGRIILLLGIAAAAFYLADHWPKRWPK